MESLIVIREISIQPVFIVLVVIAAIMSIFVLSLRRKVRRAALILKKAKHQPLSDIDESDIECLFSHKRYQLHDPFMPIYYQWIRKIYLACVFLFGLSALYLLFTLNVPQLVLDAHDKNKAFIASDSMVHLVKILIYYIVSLMFYLLSSKSLMRFYHATYKELLRDSKRRI